MYIREHSICFISLYKLFMLGHIHMYMCMCMYARSCLQNHIFMPANLDFKGKQSKEPKTHLLFS